MWFTQGWVHPCDLNTHGMHVISSLENVQRWCFCRSYYSNSRFWLLKLQQWGKTLKPNTVYRLLFQISRSVRVIAAKSWEKHLQSNVLLLFFPSCCSSGQCVGASGDRFPGLPVGSHPHQLSAHHCCHTGPVWYHSVQAQICHRGEFDTNTHAQHTVVSSVKSFSRCSVS